jgi:hypothetical protein
VLRVVGPHVRCLRLTVLEETQTYWQDEVYDDVIIDEAQVRRLTLVVPIFSHLAELWIHAVIFESFTLLSLLVASIGGTLDHLEINTIRPLDMLDFSFPTDCSVVMAPVNTNVSRLTLDHCEMWPLKWLGRGSAASSLRTLTLTLPFILNDFGTTCLQSFLEYGNISCLELNVAEFGLRDVEQFGETFYCM